VLPIPITLSAVVKHPLRPTTAVTPEPKVSLERKHLGSVLCQ